MIWVLCGAGAAGLVFFVSLRYGVDALLRRQRAQVLGHATWEDKGPTPLGEKRFTPQGLTWVNGKLIFANTWKNTKSRVYEIDPATMTIQRTFDMPPEAVHTSGFAWDGEHLWGVDYISNRAYCIDLEASLGSGRVQLVGQFETTLRGTSACCLVPWNGRICLAISDYRRTRRTIFVRQDEALAAGTAAGNIEFEYLNEGLSQGLEYVDGHLFEGENKLGTDVINKISLEKLRETPDAHQATVRQYAAPSGGIEDLAWDGRSIWTSDESGVRVVGGTLDTPPGEREEDCGHA